MVFMETRMVRQQKNGEHKGGGGSSLRVQEQKICAGGAGYPVVESLLESHVMWSFFLAYLTRFAINSWPKQFLNPSSC